MSAIPRCSKAICTPALYSNTLKRSHARLISTQSDLPASLDAAATGKKFADAARKSAANKLGHSKSLNSNDSSVVGAVFIPKFELSFDRLVANTFNVVKRFFTGRNIATDTNDEKWRQKLLDQTVAIYELVNKAIAKGDLKSVRTLISPGYFIQLTDNLLPPNTRLQRQWSMEMISQPEVISLMHESTGLPGQDKETQALVKLQTKQTLSMHNLDGTPATGTQDGQIVKTVTQYVCMKKVEMSGKFDWRIQGEVYPDP